MLHSGINQEDDEGMNYEELLVVGVIQTFNSVLANGMINTNTLNRIESSDDLLSRVIIESRLEESRIKELVGDTILDHEINPFDDIEQDTTINNEYSFKDCLEVEPQKIPISYKEPSKEEVIRNLEKNIPNQPDFCHNGTAVLPVSLRELKANFIDGEFTLLKFWQLDSGGTNTDQSEWASDNLPADFAECYDGKKTLRYRWYKATVPVKGIPLVREAHVTKHFMIYEDTATTLRIKVIVRTEGTPASPNRVQTLEALDFWTADAASEQVAFRSTLFVHFFKRPSLIAGKIERSIKAKGPESFGKLTAFFERVSCGRDWVKCS